MSFQEAFEKLRHEDGPRYEETSGGVHSREFRLVKVWTHQHRRVYADMLKTVKTVSISDGTFTGGSEGAGASPKSTSELAWGCSQGAPIFRPLALHQKNWSVRSRHHFCQFFKSGLAKVLTGCPNCSEWGEALLGFYPRHRQTSATRATRATLILGPEANKKPCGRDLDHEAPFVTNRDNLHGTSNR